MSNEDEDARTTEARIAVEALLAELRAVGSLFTVRDPAPRQVDLQLEILDRYTKAEELCAKGYVDPSLWVAILQHANRCGFLSWRSARAVIAAPIVTPGHLNMLMKRSAYKIYAELRTTPSEAWGTLGDLVSPEVDEILEIKDRGLCWYIFAGLGPDIPILPTVNLRTAQITDSRRVSRALLWEYVYYHIEKHLWEHAKIEALNHYMSPIAANLHHFITTHARQTLGRFA